MILIWRDIKWKYNLFMNHYKYLKAGGGLGMPYWSSGDTTNQKINTKLEDLLGWVDGEVEK